MNLLELTEPIFQYVCRLNRLGRKSGTSSGETSFIAKGPGGTQVPRVASLDYAVVRSEVKAMFEDLIQKSNSDMRLNVQAKKMELPLVFFVDSMISESSLPFAAQWNQNRLAYERNELAGDEKFFDLLEETIKDSGEDASERLAVYYICIGLGFSGIYFRQPEYLRKTMLTIAPRIRHLVEADQTARICPMPTKGSTRAIWCSRRAARWCWWGFCFYVSFWRWPLPTSFCIALRPTVCPLRLTTSSIRK